MFLSSVLRSPCRSAFRPRLELLEDRCVPSTLKVTNLYDSRLGGWNGHVLRDGNGQLRHLQHRDGPHRPGGLSRGLTTWDAWRGAFLPRTGHCQRRHTERTARVFVSSLHGLQTGMGCSLGGVPVIFSAGVAPCLVSRPSAADGRAASARFWSCSRTARCPARSS